MSEDRIFKALADPHRRRLLDLLFQHDGRSLSDLQTHLPMSRFGVMKHLQILAEAGLVTSRKIGREKRHYLNVVPIQGVYDRWVGKYARPWARTLTGLKDVLEATAMSEPIRHVFVIFIRTTPERLWQALTDGSLTRHYYFGTSVASTWQPGASYGYSATDGNLLLSGDILESEPPHRLVMTFRPHWITDAAPLPPSQVTWEIEPQGETCKLTLIHADLAADHPAAANIIEGWARITSGLKTLLETGDALFAPAAATGAARD